MNFNRNDILNIFIGVIVIFALIIFIDLSNINLNPEEQTNKKVIQVVNIEALTPKKEESDTSINLNPISDFCKSSSDSLKESCSKLTKKNCNSTTCCVMLNGEKCVVGNKDGPIFKTELGKDIAVDYYYYQNKCYGNNCPSK